MHTSFLNTFLSHLPVIEPYFTAHFYYALHWFVEAARLPPNSDPDAQTGLQVSRRWIKIGPQGGRIYIGFLEVINPSSGCLRGQILNLASKVDQTQLV